MLLQCDSFESIQLDELMSAVGWQARYRIIMAWSKVISLKPHLRRDEHIIRGCDAAVWLKHEVDDFNHHQFFFDSDSRIIKGLVAMILSHVHDKKAEEINLKVLEKHIEQVGLHRHLSASRANGFTRILNHIEEKLISHNAANNVSTLDLPS